MILLYYVSSCGGITPINNGPLWGQAGQGLLISTRIEWSFSKSPKEVFNVQGSLHSSNTQPMMVQFQVLRIVTWQSPSRVNPKCHLGLWWHWWGNHFKPCEPSPLSSMLLVITLTVYSKLHQLCIILTIYTKFRASHQIYALQGSTNNKLLAI